MKSKLNRDVGAIAGYNGNVTSERGLTRAQELLTPNPRKALCNPSVGLVQDLLAIGSGGDDDALSDSDSSNSALQAVSAHQVVKGATQKTQTWLDRVTNWMSAWRDPLAFPSASAISTNTAGNLLHADMEHAIRIIEQPNAKREFLHDMVAYLTEQEALSIAQGERIKQRIEPLLKKGPICIHVFDPERQHHRRNKRMSQADADRAIVEHIKENCAFEEEILDTDGRGEGEVLLFKAQRADNPFRAIYDGRADYGPSPGERGAADGLNFLFNVMTFGIGPAVSGQIAHSYRNELYHKRGDGICKTRLQHLALAEIGTSLNVDNLGGGVFSRSSVPGARSVELSSAHTFQPEASFVARDPETGISHGLRRRIFRSGQRPRIRHHHQGHLQLKRRGAEYFIHDRHKPNDPDHRVILDESSGQWQYADELPPATHEPGMSILRRDRKAFVTVQGQEHELHWNFRDNRYEIVVDKAGSREKVYLPAYMDPLSKTWQLTVRNGRPVYTAEQLNVVDHWSVDVSPESQYRQVENLQPAYYERGPLFEVREPVHGYTSQPQYLVVEMGGKLVPARANVIPGRGVSYEAYQLNSPGQPGRPIEWDNWQWVFESDSSRQLPLGLRDKFRNQLDTAADVGPSSVPDDMGLRWTVDGKSYLKLDGRYIEIKKLSGAPNRFYVGRSTRNKIVLRFEKGGFRLESVAERLAVIRETGLGGRVSVMADVMSPPTLEEVALEDFILGEHPGVRLRLNLSEELLTPEELALRKEYERLSNKLHIDSDNFFRNLPAIERKPMLPLESDLSDDGRVFEFLFEQRSGVVIGEIHSEVESKALLIENMAELRRKGVSVIFLEGLSIDDIGTDLLEYEALPSNAPMPDRMRQKLDSVAIQLNRDPRAPYNIRRLTESAHRNGIAIRPLECLAVNKVVSTHAASLRRLADMHYIGGAIINQAQNRYPGVKWVALVGAAHINTMSDVPGLSELAGALSVDVRRGGASHFEIGVERRMGGFRKWKPDYTWVRSPSLAR
ncbi:membrane-targeted effector domain-containing toxin (plasmid) [Burkholderia pyrrocinia]|uniref:membrane-targeted effector domain-containing toxin n=1 Tax=Burkholderia pyrrocinia TaxID=60550 RepID=UPI0038B50173